MNSTALSPAQVDAFLERLIDQAEAERQRVFPKENREKPEWGYNQLVNNLLMKGQFFRDLVSFEPSPNGVEGGRIDLVEKLLTKVMGEGFGIGCAHGAIIGQGGGLQEIHIDQGAMPLPYPPWPYGSLIIWMGSEFSLENGGTYCVPGSHRTWDGKNSFHENQVSRLQLHTFVYMLTM